MQPTCAGTWEMLLTHSRIVVPSLCEHVNRVRGWHPHAVNKMWQTKNGNVACWIFFFFCFEILKDCACSWFALGRFWLRIPAWDHIFLGVIRSPHVSWTPENVWELREESRLNESMKLSNVETVIHFVVFYTFHHITFVWLKVLDNRKEMQISNTYNDKAVAYKITTVF